MIGAMDLPQHGRDVDDVIADLRAQARRRRPLAGRPDLRDGLRRWARACTRSPSGPRMLYLHENALNTEGVPVARPDPVTRSCDGRPVCCTVPTRRPGSSPAAAPSRSSAPCSRPASGVAPSAASSSARSWSPSRPMPRSTSRPTCTTCRSTRRRSATTGPPTSTRWPTPSTTTRCSSWVRPRSIPQGVVDPIPEIAAARRLGRRQLSRRRLHGRLRAAVRRDARPRGPTVGLPGRRRALDLGRHPQARLRTEGGVGDPAPHEGAAPLPDLHVRRLAGRLLRLAEPAGHPLGSPDGGRLGGDAAPRCRRLSSS